MANNENKFISNEQFYIDVLTLLNSSSIPYVIGGTYAIRLLTGIRRETEDLDIFCKGGDYQRFLKLLSEQGFQTEITDARWIAKALRGDQNIDFIFNTPNMICPVDDAWIESGVKSELFGVEVKFSSPVDIIWTKIYIQDRIHYDGADVNHLFLKCGRGLDWKRLLGRLDQHWDLLLSQLLNFRFIYPSERDVIPDWLLDELLERLKTERALPASIDKVCRGPIVDQSQYDIDINEWGYKVITSNNL